MQVSRLRETQGSSTEWRNLEDYVIENEPADWFEDEENELVKQIGRRVEG